MAVTITICGLFFLPLALECTRGYTVPVDEILTVMPMHEFQDTGPFQWIESPLPRTLVEVSDLGCGDLYPEAEIQEILVLHPEMIPPCREHVEAILAVGRQAQAKSVELGRDWHLVVHCHGGSSRSVAAAYILLAQQFGPGHEDLAYAELCKIAGMGPSGSAETGLQRVSRSAPDPNHNLVHLADQALGTGGRLLDLVRAGHPA